MSTRRGSLATSAATPSTPERAGPPSHLACSAVEIVLGALLVIALAWFVTGPLRAVEGTGEAAAAAHEADLADLEARKEALYRQIRDAELDRAQGKLSDADFERLDADLRREAIALLKRIDAVGDQPV